MEIIILKMEESNSLKVVVGIYLLSVNQMQSSEEVEGVAFGTANGGAIGAVGVASTCTPLFSKSILCLALFGDN